MYSTAWCGDCRSAKRFLAQHGVSYEEVDIDGHPAAAQQVIEWSGGRRVIPTFLITSEHAGTRVILHNPRHAALASAIGITA
jgi:mycoredoxin